jgi:hypothetical protein
MAAIHILALIVCVTVSCNSFADGCAGAGAPIVGIPITGIGKKKCLYEEADLRMADGSKMKVKDLRIGDEVLAYSVHKGIHASPIIGELHNDNETMVKIFEIETNGGRKVQVTGDHSLFVRQCLSDDQTWSAKMADEVSVGDCVPRYYMADGEVIEEAVSKIRVFDARGIRQLVTETGTIIVDDVVISCYAGVVNQDATHMALLPYRLMSRFTQSSMMTQFKSLLPSFFNLIGFMETSLISN